MRVHHDLVVALNLGHPGAWIAVDRGRVRRLPYLLMWKIRWRIDQIDND
jgi:hypothetical protein